jgi:hypothetical protein
MEPADDGFVFRGHKKKRSQKNCNAELRVQRACGDIWVRRPMDMMLAAALALLIVGCVVGYSLRAEIANDRSAEPRRPRPF